MSIDGPVLSIDCAQRTSVLALSRAAGEAPTVRAFAAGSGAREAFWDELRALESEGGVPAQALRGVAVVLGPGGFTGLRVAVAAAKGVAYALGIPAAGLPSSEVFAASHALRHGLRGARVLVALASKGDTAFVAEVEIGAEGASSARERASSVIGPDALAAALRAGVPAAVLSDEHLAPSLAEVLANHGAKPAGLETDGAALDMLARRALAESPADPFALVPVYPREPEAVTNWRLRKSSS